MTGYTGLLSLGHAAFVGVGAYTVALVQLHLGLPFYLAIPLGGRGSGGDRHRFRPPFAADPRPLSRHRDTGRAVHPELRFVHWQSVTKGDVGLTVQPATVFGYPLNNETRVYYLILFCVVVATWFAVNVIRSRVGRAFIAIRERDLTAEVLGVQIVWYKLVAFALGSFYAGVAGGLLAYFNQFVNPEQFGLLLSVFFLSAVIVGGMGSTLGAILGAVFMTLLPEFLREGALGRREHVRVRHGVHSRSTQGSGLRTADGRIPDSRTARLGTIVEARTSEIFTLRSGGVRTLRRLVGRRLANKVIDQI